MKKIAIVHFQKIKKRPGSLDSLSHYFMAEVLKSEELLSKVICRDGVASSGVLNDSDYKCFNKMRSFKLINKIVKEIGRFININTRHIEERIFEQFILLSLKQISPNVVYFSKPLFLHAVNYCKQNNITCIVRASTAYPTFNYRILRMEKRLLGQPKSCSMINTNRTNKLVNVFKRSDYVLLPSERVAKFTYDTFKGNINKQRIIQQYSVYGTYANHRFAKKPLKNYFIHVSHMAPIKGLDYLLLAWKELQAYKYKAKLYLIGSVDKAYRRHLENITNDDSVIMLGYIENPFAKFSDCLAFINSSISDCAPSTFVEACNNGIPIISSRNSGFASLIEDGINGFTYKYSDYSCLADLMMWFLKNPEKVMDIRENIAKRSDIFSEKEYKKDILRIFNEIRK